MRNTKIMLSVLTMALALPAFTHAQGKGLGVGVGSNAQVGVGAKGSVQTPATNAKVGVKSDTDAHVKTGAQTKPMDADKASVGAKIESRPQLAAKVEPMLPKGTTMAQAAMGFKNQGQFIAALHASQNLNIPFDQLKAKMTGTDSVSLGAAIRQSRPDLTEVKANAEAKKAEKEAKDTEKK